MIEKQANDARIELSRLETSKSEYNSQLLILQSTIIIEQQKVNELKQEKSIIEDSLNSIKNMPAYLDLGEKAAKHVEKYLSQRQNYLIVCLYVIRKAFLKNPEFVNLLVPTAHDMFDAPLHSRYLEPLKLSSRSS
jgi:hypothetical protein